MTAQARIAKGMWWDKAWQLTSGCSPVSPGCMLCWLAMSARMRSRQQNPKTRALYEGLTTSFPRLEVGGERL